MTWGRAHAGNLVLGMRYFIICLNDSPRNLEASPSVVNKSVEVVFMGCHFRQLSRFYFWGNSYQSVMRVFSGVSETQYGVTAQCLCCVAHK